MLRCERPRATTYLIPRIRIEKNADLIRLILEESDVDFDDSEDEDVNDAVEEQTENKNISSDDEDDLPLFTIFATEFKKKWVQSNRKPARFLENNKEWLLSSIGFSTYSTAMKRKIGRPEICFEEATDRTKRVKTKDLRTMHTTQELSYATQMNLRASGQTDAAKILKDITTISPKRATKHRAAFSKYGTESSFQAKRLSSSDALSLFVDANLTRMQYNKIKAKAPFVFSSYKEIQRAKKECYPNIIVVTETSAEVQLQAFLDHTAKRIVQLREDVIRC
ncbi:hypothetical protein EVAR_99884_1 [Eumeta japonica]|uniref:Uncharacterized protein n=1 Tax=Eumeta variegata TaxID=151549 RepID=A0A4C1ZI63_EUMVA|nr:hypothetical protein EVAR_99884_1 [Eumeta japonica]